MKKLRYIGPDDLNEGKPGEAPRSFLIAGQPVKKNDVVEVEDAVADQLLAHGEKVELVE